MERAGHDAAKVLLSGLSGAGACHLAGVHKVLSGFS